MNAETRPMKAIQLLMSVTDLAKLDAYCEEGRRRTGKPFQRTTVIRDAIAKVVESPTSE